MVLVIDHNLYYTDAKKNNKEKFWTHTFKSFRLDGIHKLKDFTKMNINKNIQIFPVISPLSVFDSMYYYSHELIKLVYFNLVLNKIQFIRVIFFFIKLLMVFTLLLIFVWSFTEPESPTYL